MVASLEALRWSSALAFGREGGRKSPGTAREAHSLLPPSPALRPPAGGCAWPQEGLLGWRPIVRDESLDP